MDLGFVAEIVEAARADGRDTLLEAEGLAILEGIGIATPRSMVVLGPADANDLDLSSLAGDRVVLKVLAPDIIHKTDVGGVSFVKKDLAPVVDAMRAMAISLERYDVRGFMVSELVEYDSSLGGELLLSARWTDDFGPVVGLGPGGLYAEFLAKNLPTGKEVSLVASVDLDSDTARSLIEGMAVSRLLIGGWRGEPPRVETEKLVQTLTRFGELARRTVPRYLEEIEINPLVVSQGGLAALDVLARCGGGRPRPAERSRPVQKLQNLLHPDSIALIGVSERMNPGRVILSNLLDEDFDRSRIHVIKPDCEEIEGCRCYPDLGALPERVDLLVIAVDAEQVPELLEEVVEGGRAESVIVIPGGLGEKAGGEDRVARVRRILEGSRSTEWAGPLVNGGNCMGIRSRPGGYDTTFIPRYKLPLGGRPCPMALISQSGAFYAAKLSRLGVDPKYSISVGNQMDVTVGDYLEHLARDRELALFAIYLEGFRPLDGRRFLAAVREISGRGGAVICYRAGRTPEGAKASASHTAAIAGDYVVTRELVRGAGGIVCETLADFDDLLKLYVLLRERAPSGRRLGAVSNAGFECVAVADHVGPLTLARLADSTRWKLGLLLDELGLRDIVDVRNPLDVTPMAGDASFVDAVRTVLADEGVDIGIVGCVPLTPALQTLGPDQSHPEDLWREHGILDDLVRLKEKSTKPWAIAIDGGPLYDSFARALEANGIPTFQTIDRAARILGRFCEERLGSRSESVE